MHIGSTHRAIGNIDMAEANLRLALDLQKHMQPRDVALLHAFLGRLSLDQESWEPAQVHLAKAVEMGSQVGGHAQRTALTDLAMLHVQKKRYDAALGCIDQAVPMHTLQGDIAALLRSYSVLVHAAKGANRSELMQSAASKVKELQRALDEARSGLAGSR